MRSPSVEGYGDWHKYCSDNEEWQPEFRTRNSAVRLLKCNVNTIKVKTGYDNTTASSDT